MRTKIILLSILITTSILSAKTLAVVNGEELTEDDIKPMLKMFPNAKSLSDLTKDEKEMVIDQTLEKKLIVQRAKREEVYKDPKFKAVMDDFKNKLLLEFWMKERFDSIKVTDKEIRDYFEKNREKYPKNTKLESIKEKLQEKLKTEKFRKLMDGELSNMKKKAKIEYRVPL